MTSISKKPAGVNPAKPQVTAIHPVDDNHRVVTVEGGGSRYMTRPCAQCPWRVDQTVSFPAGAFKRSAKTAEDMSREMFACHMAGADNPATCAGFLLNGAEHNLGYRLAVIQGRIEPRQVSDGGLELHGSYREMAIANWVDEDDPALYGCRG